MKPLERDMHLQQLILQGDDEQTRAFYEEEKIPRPLSRALGYACRYGTPQIVQMLVDGGAQVRYRRTSARIEENGIAPLTRLGSITEPYLYLLGPDVSKRVGSSRLPTLDGTHQRVQGKDYDEIVHILVQDSYKTGFDPSAMLFFAVLYEDEDAVQALEKAGATRLFGPLYRLMSDEMNGTEATDYDAYIHEYYETITRMASEQEDLRPLLRRLYAIADGPVRLREIPWEERWGPNHWRDEALRPLMEYTTLGKRLQKKDFLEQCVRCGCAQTLEWALDNGWARSWRDYENLKEIAAETNYGGELEALLLQKQYERGFKRPRAQSVNPFSASNLRRIWSARELSDGQADELEIFSYKGTDDPYEGRVIVPDRIGKRTVTSLDAGTFRTWRTPSEKIETARENMRELTIPGTIRKIPPSLVTYHSMLQKLTIGDGTTDIGECAFSHCEALKEVILPDSVRHIDASAFMGCTNLRHVEIGEHTHIDPSAFWGCTSLGDGSGFIHVGGRIAAVDVQQMPPVLALTEDEDVSVYEPFRRLLPPLTYRSDSGTEPTALRIPPDLKAGDDLVFGQFPHDTDYMLQPLHWTCIAREGDTALCITRDAVALLYASRDMTASWFNHTEQMINDAFAPVMFSAEEQGLLQTDGTLADSRGRAIFLLHRRDIERYMPAKSPLRRCSVTPYAKGQLGKRAGYGNKEPGTWLLGESEEKHPSMVLADTGNISSTSGLYWHYTRSGDSAGDAALNDEDRILAIRPAIQLRIPQPT